MKYRFDQIAVNITTKKKPTEQDRFNYIGLEHLDSGSLTVSRWGSDVAPKGEKLLMHKGDVLFGKRRAYQKKVAIAPFDGIFSAHGMVLRPNEEVIDKNFFPMFISSDYFLDAAIALSVGSLSPTINWRDLARQEFELPPIEKQRELADVLWSIEDTRTAYQELATATEELVKSRFVEMFGAPLLNPMGWEVKPLLEMGDCKNGMNFHKDESGIELNCLGVGDFQNLSVISDTSALPTVSLNVMPSKEYLLENEDIVFVRSNGNKNLVGRCLAVYPNDTPTVFSGFCIRFRLADKERLTIGYLLQVLKHESMRKKMTGRGANIQNLNQQILSTLDIPLPPIDLQNQFSDFVALADKSKLVIQETLEKHAVVKAAIMCEWLK